MSVRTTHLGVHVEGADVATVHVVEEGDALLGHAAVQGRVHDGVVAAAFRRRLYVHEVTCREIINGFVLLLLLLFGTFCCCIC